MHQTVAERRRFDSAAGGRAADRDRFELRHHARHHAFAQSGGGQHVVGRHALDADPALLGVDFENVMEVADIQAPLRACSTVAE